MASTPNRMRSASAAERWRVAPADDGPFDTSELENYRELPTETSSPPRRASRGFARFVITFGLGVAATLAWQMYGDAIRVLAATSSPQLAWLAPQARPAPAAPVTVGAAPSAPSSDRHQLEAMSLDLAVTRQRVEQLAAQLAFNQQQTVDQIARLQAAEEDVLRRIPTSPPLQASAAARKPVPPRLPPATLAPPVR